jgi:hypothetical protein
MTWFSQISRLAFQLRNRQSINTTRRQIIPFRLAADALLDEKATATGSFVPIGFGKYEKKIV